jgi:hypothetical protein
MVSLIRRTLLTVFIVGFILGLIVSHAHASAFTLATGNTQSLGCDPTTRTVRIIIPAWAPATIYANCARNATATGHRLILVDQYKDCATLTADAKKFRTILTTYPRAWAVAIGNEQDFPTEGGIGCNRSYPATTPRAYVRVWRRLQPILRRREPHALRVAGETGPWGDGFIVDALALGLPHAQVIAAHPYPKVLGYSPHSYIRLAHYYHLQAWADEGMCGTDSWTPFGCSTPRTLKHEGYSLGGEWYVSTPAITATI